MKRYDCYYTNDFGDDYPAFSKETDDGDWVSFNDHAAELAEAVAMGQNFKDIADELRDDLHGANNKLTSVTLDRDALRRGIKATRMTCCGNSSDGLCHGCKALLNLLEARI